MNGADEGRVRKLTGAMLYCREHSLMDAFETSYNVLRIEYLRMVSQAFEDAAAWQDAEAALFALRCQSDV